MSHLFYQHSFTYIGVVETFGMLAMDVMCVSLPKVILKVALRAGSSKQGKALRASVASNCVDAINLGHKKRKF